MECPICAQRLDDTAPSCGGCGFPTALHRESLKGLDETENPAPPTSPKGRTASERRQAAAAVPHARDQTAEACSRAARELRGHIRVLLLVGGNAEPFLAEMRQAALVQSEGRAAESLDLLRAAESRAVRDSRELFARRAQELENRTAALLSEGVRTEVEDPLEKLRDALSLDHWDQAAAFIVSTDEQLKSLEQDWRGLHTLLEQISQLQTAAREAGKPVPVVDDDLAQVQMMLSRPQVDRELLDTAAQVASRALMLLHEALPAILELDLEQHGSVLSVYPTDHEPSRQAKAIHADAARHLRRGRLPEASARLADLRVAIRDLGRSARTPKTASPEPLQVSETVPDRKTAPPAPTEADTLPRLLSKARSLAARVRALPPDSELAFEAAGEIRRATELLRARKLEEAETTLSHLMRTLDFEPAPEA